MLGADFILNCLVKEQIDHLFMVPGGLIDPFLPALERAPSLKPIIAAQEGGAAYMADGYARASGKWGAALCIGGPGLTNTVTAVATAKTDGSPLFVLSGEAATDIEGLGLFQDASSQTLDDVSILKPITNYSSSVDDPKNLRHILQHALLHLRTHPQGPVHLSIPKNCQTAPFNADYEPINPALIHSAVLSENAAENSLTHFIDPNAKRIVFLAGAGLEHSESSQSLLQFAERWHIPVATTLRAKGVFPEDHPLSLGVFGYAGTHHSKAAILDQSPDLLIILGSGLNERDSMHWTLRLTPEKTISVNTSAFALGSTLPSCSVVGDVGAYLKWLASKGEQLQPLNASVPERKKWLDEIKAKPRLQQEANLESTAIPIHPARIVNELRKVFPREGILLVDSGAHRAFSGHYWESYLPRTYLSATNLGPMGWAIPAAVGAQCARPSSKIAVITGDGCMHMHGLEIATAARYQLPIIYIVVNNSALGNVWLRAHTLGSLPCQLTSLPDVDWSAFSRSLGGEGITVTKPEDLQKAFLRALANNKPTVIDVKADKHFLTPVEDWSVATANWSYHE